MFGSSKSSGKTIRLAGLSVAGTLALALSPFASALPSTDGSDAHLVWSFTRAGETFTSYAVSIGNDGSQVFSDTGLWSRKTRLFSAFDGTTSSPVWESTDSSRSYFQKVCSVPGSDEHYSIFRREDPTTPGKYLATLKRYRSSSSAPNLTYDFPLDILSYKDFDVHASADGDTVVALARNQLNGTADFAIFRFGSNTPSYHQVDMFGNYSWSAVSSDGSTLYVATPAQMRVFDLPSGQERSVTNLYGIVTDGHSISGDGSWIAYPRDGEIYVHHRSGSSYPLSFRYADPDAYWCMATAIDEAGDVLVAAFETQDALKTIVVALDLHTQTVLVREVFDGNGSQQNIPTAIDVSADGDRFAVGMWGGSGVPELVVYQRRDPGVPASRYNRLATFDRPGSVFDIDLSADGGMVATCGKNTHASVATGDKVNELFALGSADLNLRGSPARGQSVTLEVQTAPNSPVHILRSRNRLAIPRVFSCGELELAMDSTWSMTYVGDADSSGHLTETYPISSSEAPGTTYYFQFFSEQPRTLSEDMVQMTVLP